MVCGYIILYIKCITCVAKKTTQRIWKRWMNRSAKRFILIPSVDACGAGIGSYSRFSRCILSVYTLATPQHVDNQPWIWPILARALIYVWCPRVWRCFCERLGTRLYMHYLTCLSDCSAWPVAHQTCADQPRTWPAFSSTHAYALTHTTVAEKYIRNLHFVVRTPHFAVRASRFALSHNFVPLVSR